MDLGEPGILAQEIGQGAALKPLTVQPPFAPWRQQAIGDQYEQDLIRDPPVRYRDKPVPTPVRGPFSMPIRGPDCVPFDSQNTQRRSGRVN